jgi:Ca-activated chloride channel homolog
MGRAPRRHDSADSVRTEAGTDAKTFPSGRPVAAAPGRNSPSPANDGYNELTVFWPKLALISWWAAALSGIPQEPAPPQEQPPADQEGFRIGVAVNQVFLSVNARSVGGGFVRDLDQDDFLVFEEGRLQRIENFYTGQVPVKAVLLVDVSGSSQITLTDIRRAAWEFVQRLDPEDEIAVVTFNHQTRLLLDFSKDRSKVRLALDSMYARGYTVLNDALYVIFDDLLRELRGKTAVIMLTDGIDTASMVSWEAASELALRTDTMVYVVSQSDEYRAQAIGIRQQLRSMSRIIPKQLQDDYIAERKQAMARLANLSGGRLLNSTDFHSLTDVYQQIADEIKNQYYLSYIPTDQTRDGSWRSIDVKLSRGGVVASTRPGYYAPGPVAAIRQ